MIGTETSSRNNEVVHAGFLYPPNSLRGTLCRPGAEMLRDYCRERGIGLAVHGKLMLALTEDEEGLLETMMAFGEGNGVQGLQLLSAEGVKEREPEITCRMALYSPNTAVVHSHATCSPPRRRECWRGVISEQHRVGGQKVPTVEDEMRASNWPITHQCFRPRRAGHRKLPRKRQRHRPSRYPLCKRQLLHPDRQAAFQLYRRAFG